MKATIWKYEIEVEDNQMVLMPRGARILDVQVQGEPRHDIATRTMTDPPICLWALVDPSAEACRRRIAVVGTGHDASRLVSGGEFSMFAAVSDYIGTFQLRGGSFVGHVFDLGEATEG